jgi:hypothetical protein
VGGVLYLEGNDSLTNLDGLASLTTVGEGLSVVSNASLENLDGLGSLNTIFGGLTILSNADLCQSFVDNFVDNVSVTGTVSVSGNDENC